MTAEQMRESLEESLGSKASVPSFEIQMREDFRRIEARYVCTAKQSLEELCLRFKPGMNGCTFCGESRSCGAENG